MNDLGILGYVRYVDDFVMIHSDKKYLIECYGKIRDFIKTNLGLTLHHDKVYLQEVSKGVKFIGSVIKPNRTYISNRVVDNLLNSIRLHNNLLKGDGHDEVRIKNKVSHFRSVLNSYYGFMKHHSTYKIRKDIWENKLKPEWKKALVIDENYQVISSAPGFTDRDLILESYGLTYQISEKNGIV